jgi:hypothetical protein
VGRSTIDAAIDRYVDAAGRAGAPMPDGPASQRDLDDIRAAIAPLGLGDDVAAMWARFQAPPAMPYPSWLSARYALDIWQEDREEAAVGFPLFPIAYESHGFLSAGLVGDPHESVIWRWAYDAEPATLRFRTLAVAFDAAADALQQGIFEWRDEHRYLEVLDDQAWEAVVRVRNEEAVADGVFDPGITRVDLQSPLTWPEAWQRACGIDVRAAVPRGRTATVAEFLASSSTSATIAGTIAGLVGTAEGSRATIDDGTGHLAVWCPREADPFFAVRNRESVEIDIVRSPGTAGGSEADLDRQHATIQNAIVHGDMVAAQVAALRIAGFAGPESVDAIAVAVRPSEAASQARPGPGGISRR